MAASRWRSVEPRWQGCASGSVGCQSASGNTPLSKRTREEHGLGPHLQIISGGCKGESITDEWPVHILQRVVEGRAERRWAGQGPLAWRFFEFDSEEADSG